MKLNNNFLINTISFLFISIIILLFPQNANSEDKKEMKSSVKYTTELKGIKEYKLSNGLKILLKPNHSIPLITFSVWYKVGSRNETDYYRGLAHFLEHMMFKGTKKFKKGEISAIIQRHGGVFNAFTSSDGTAYYETISPKYLEKVIEIESDRMKGSLLTDEELNLERTVVLSELEGDLNNPATYLDQKLRSIAYEKSPYKHPTIGYEGDIKKLNSNIMQEFYKRFYNPTNAFILLTGDFNQNKALRLIEKYFGSIRNDNTSATEIPTDEEQNHEKRFSIKRTGSFKILEIAYHITNTKDKDIYPLNIIEEILIKGKKSRLNKALVEKGLATEIYGGAETNKDPGLFYILISLTPKANHKQVEKIVFNEIKKLIENPPNENEINAAKNRIKANYLYSLDGTYNQALNTGYFELVNTWKQSLEWTDKITKVTQNEISTVLKKYFSKQNRTIGYFIPKIRKGEKYEPQPIGLIKTHNYKSPDIKSINSNSKNSLYSQPFKYKRTTLSDSSELLIYNSIDLPITYISGAIKGGSSLIPKEKEWACQIITRTLEKGSKKYTKEQIEEYLDSTGSQIEFTCDEESFKFHIATLNDNLEQTLSVLSDVLINPTFPLLEIKKEKEKIIAEIIESKDSTSEIARRVFTQLIYPKEHPYYSNNFEDDIKLIKTINNKDLNFAHNEIIKKNKLIISIVSNIDSKKLNSIIKILEDNIHNENKNEGHVNIPDSLLSDIPKIKTIYVKDKMQSDVFLGHAGNIKRTDPDFYKIYIANYILGGSSLSSRLARRVRDNSGLVYTVYSYINASHGKGEFGVYFGSNNFNVDKAIELVKDELQKFVKSGITEEELKKAKASLIDSFVSRNLSTYRSIADTLTGVEFYNLGENYINNYPQIINSQKLIEINQSIKKYIFPDKLNISIAGEYKKQNTAVKAESLK